MPAIINVFFCEMTNTKMRCTAWILQEMKNEFKLLIAFNISDVFGGYWASHFKARGVLFVLPLTNLV